MKGGEIMENVTGQAQERGLIKCAARCASICIYCVATPIPGVDDAMSAVGGAVVGASEW